MRAYDRESPLPRVSQGQRKTPPPAAVEGGIVNPYDRMFDLAGYYPCRCPEHPEHAVNRDDTTGDMRCTAGCLVAATPRVRDDEDRIAIVLREMGKT